MLCLRENFLCRCLCCEKRCAPLTYNGFFDVCARVCAVSRSSSKGDHKCSYMNKSDGELVHCIAMSCTCCITIEDDCVACCDVTNSMFGLSILANLRKLDELNERSDENGGRQAVITTLDKLIRVKSMPNYVFSCRGMSF